VSTSVTKMLLSNKFISFIQENDDFNYLLQVLINSSTQLLYGEFDHNKFENLKIGLTMLKNVYKTNTAEDDDLDNTMNTLFSKIEMRRNVLHLERINQGNIIQKNTLKNISIQQ